jgi:hypothetical protein
MMNAEMDFMTSKGGNILSIDDKRSVNSDKTFEDNADSDQRFYFEMKCSPPDKVNLISLPWLSI